MGYADVKLYQLYPMVGYQLLVQVTSFGLFLDCSLFWVCAIVLLRSINSFCHTFLKYPCRRCWDCCGKYWCVVML